MGGAVSTDVKKLHINENRSEEDILSFVMPIYYTEKEVTEIEKEAAVGVWKMILNNRSSHFLKLKQTDPANYGQYENCMEFWFQQFYTRLFDVHPSCRSLFQRSINKQGSFFLRFISMLLLDDYGDDTKWTKSLTNLANIHNKMGIKTVEYGITGECIFYTIKKCVGDAYTTTAHMGWTKIFSHLLKIVTPLVIRFELTNKVMTAQIAEKRSGLSVPQIEDPFAATKRQSSAAGTTISIIASPH